MDWQRISQDVKSFLKKAEVPSVGIQPDPNYDPDKEFEEALERARMTEIESEDVPRAAIPPENVEKIRNLSEEDLEESGLTKDQVEEVLGRNSVFPWGFVGPNRPSGWRIPLLGALAGAVSGGVIGHNKEAPMLGAILGGATGGGAGLLHSYNQGRDFDQTRNLLNLASNKGIPVYDWDKVPSSRTLVETKEASQKSVSQDVKAFLKQAVSEKGLRVSPEALRAGKEKGYINLLRDKVPDYEIAELFQNTDDIGMTPQEIYEKALNAGAINNTGGATYMDSIPYRSTSGPNRSTFPVWWKPGSKRVRRHELLHWIQNRKAQQSPDSVSLLDDPVKAIKQYVNTSDDTYRLFRPWKGSEFQAGYQSGKAYPLMSSGNTRKTSILRGLHEGLFQRYAHSPRWGNNSILKKPFHKGVEITNRGMANLLDATRPMAETLGDAEHAVRRGVSKATGKIDDVVRRGVRSATHKADDVARATASKLDDAGRRVARNYWDEGLEAVARYGDDALRHAGRYSDDALRYGGKALRGGKTVGKYALKAMPYIDAATAGVGAYSGVTDPENAREKIENYGVLGNVAGSIFNPYSAGRNIGGAARYADQMVTNPGGVARGWWDYYKKPRGYLGQASAWMGGNAGKGYAKAKQTAGDLADQAGENIEQAGQAVNEAKNRVSEEVDILGRATSDIKNRATRGAQRVGQEVSSWF